MRKSKLLRQIILLLLSAVLLSGVLSAVIYIVVTQKMYTKIKADELIPIAQTVAGAVANSDIINEIGDSPLSDGYTQSSENINSNHSFAENNTSENRGLMSILGPENKNFLGASIHIFDANGNQLLTPKSTLNRTPSKNGLDNPFGNPISPPPDNIQDNKQNSKFGQIFPKKESSNNESMLPLDNAYQNAYLGDPLDAELEQAYKTDLDNILKDGNEITTHRKTESGETFLVVGVPILSSDSGSSDSSDTGNSESQSQSNTSNNLNSSNVHTDFTPDENAEIVGAVIFTKPIGELNETMNSLNITLIFSTFIAFLIMLIPGYFAARRLVLPIRKMENVARAMSNGDFTIRADEHTAGEIGELGKAINHFAIESERLEQTRRDYVANVSHELRTPVASIRAMGETLRDGMAKTDEKKELFYNNIVRESMRLSRLVDDTLELSRLQAGTEAIQKKKFDFREIIANVTDIYGEILEDHGIEFDVDMGKIYSTGFNNINNINAPINVFSNPDRIEQVLIALIDNAAKHTPDTGNITLVLHESQSKLYVTVANTGSHIPAEDLPYIFDRFYKVDKSHAGAGTGLGLSITKEIIKGLGESIKAESDDDATRLTFSVALCDTKSCQ
ncbi:MAG: HAMP domain-containing histidine kinase [Clostridiales Family XIII bacterium]|jgi:signal transduction histidine kinase|nr:HAMP domain-containing histidine kinase [Clostridiales Family XIII bacterium]